MGLYSRLCTYLPVNKKKIVFCNFSGRGLGGSPKYIAEEILREGLDYDLVWMVDSDNLEFPEGIRQVKLFSPRGRYELSTARVIVDNTKHKLPFIKRNNQYYIQTWHGDFALKFIEKEVEDKLDPNYVYESKENSKETDIVLSASRQFSQIARESFWFDGEIFESGQPCHDPFFRKDDAADKVRAHLGIAPDVRIALYAPTFRDGNLDFEFPDFKEIVQTLEQLSGDRWVLLVRLHPNDIARVAGMHFTDNILNGSSYPDTQDISKASELLITDYSSIMYDFALQRKQVVLFVPDVEEYQRLRGLRGIFWEVPFPMATSRQDLPEAFGKVFGPSYKKELAAFLEEQVGSFDDGRASERVVSRIKEAVNGKINGRTNR